MNALETEAYEAGRRRGEILMKGGLNTTRVVKKSGASLLQEAGRVATGLGMEEQALIERVTEFHDERLDAVPALSTYPELKGEREVLACRYRGMADAGMTRELIALAESLGFWRDCRSRRETGRVYYRGPLSTEKRERCRVVYAPETPDGPIHFKNVDDPLSTWTPQPPITDPGPWPHAPLFYDGTGSGLHIDEEPPEIFPADAREICRRHSTTVKEAEELLTRYNYFWGSANLLIHDDEGNAVAIDKASRCRYAVRRPGPNGVIYINGMSSFDAEYQAFIEGQRTLYLEETGQDDSTPEAVYFRFAEGTLKNMKQRMAAYEKNPDHASLEEHMTSTDPDGPLCRTGRQTHPDDPVRAATLMQRCYYPDRRVMKWRQWRGETPVWDDPWETVQYAS